MSSNPNVPRDRITGVLVGTACGDALGAGYEFKPPLPPDAPVAMIGGPSGFDPGEWTDDTSMAIAIAEVVRTGADLNETAAQDQIVERWLDWQHEAKDVGNQTRAVLDATRGRPSAKAARRHAQAHHERTGRSGGNGSLMRTAPVALGYLHDPDGLAEAARSISSLTHYDSDAGDACVLWTLAIRHAILTGEFNVRVGLDWLPPVCRDRWAALIDDAAQQHPYDFEHNGWVVEALQAAWSAITTTPVPADDPATGSYPASHFQLALEAAVRAGNDTDTVAAIAGGLLGARWGVSAVPLVWQRDLHGWPGLRYPDLVELGQTPGSDRTLLSFDHLGHLASVTAHPRDENVLMGGVNAVANLPADVDAAVSLCRVNPIHVPPGVGDPRNHVQVWLIDDPDPALNPHLHFVLDQAAAMVEQLRGEERTVFLHCAAGQSRTPTVGAVYGARISGGSAAEELQRLTALIPDAHVGAHFVTALSFVTALTIRDTSLNAKNESAGIASAVPPVSLDESEAVIEIDERFDGGGGTVRITGVNGEMVILDSVLMIRRLPDREELALGVDIIIDDQWRSVRYRNRAITGADLVSLHRFLKSAMSDLHPEVSVPAFQSVSAALVLSVVASAELTIQLEVSVAEYLDDPEPDLGGCRIDVTRVSLGEPIDITAEMVDIFPGPTDATGGD